MGSGWQEWEVDLMNYYEMRNKNTSIYFSFQASVRVVKTKSSLFEIQEIESIQLCVEPRNVLTHCGRVRQICVFNTVKLGTSASSP